MNEVSIIIDGIRYDVADTIHTDNSCNECDLREFCSKVELYDYTCDAMIGRFKRFKRADKTKEK